MALSDDEVTVLNDWFFERINEMQGSLPGIFKSYDPETQTAEVIPAIKQTLLAADGSRTETELPPIPNVKVRWPRTSAGYIHFPISPGDYCQLIFNTAAIGLFRESGKVSSPGDLTRFDWSHPYAYPGAWPDADPMADAPNDAAVIVVTDHMRISKLSQAADFVALKPAIDALQQNLDNQASFGTPFGPTTPGNLAPVGPLTSSNALKAGHG